MRLLPLILSLPLAACSFSSDNDQPGIAGTGSGDHRSYQVADFSKVELRGSDDVDVKVGGGFSVRAEGDREVLDYLKLEKDGGALRIGRRNRSGFDWHGRHAKIVVTMPAIGAATTTGSGDMTIDRVAGGAFDGTLAGSGKIRIETLAVDRASFTITGSGGFKAAGNAKSVRVSITGAGDIDAKALTTAGADISIAGSGDVDLTVNGDARVSIMGAGDVDLGPAARCTVSKMGSGTVRCGR